MPYALAAPSLIQRLHFLALLLITLLVLMLLAACTTAQLDAGITTADRLSTVYCATAPEGRASLRRKLNIERVIVCPNDPAPAASSADTPPT